MLLGLPVAQIRAQFGSHSSTVLPESLTGGGGQSSGGKFSMTTAVHGGFEFNDNVNLTPEAREGFAFRGGMRMALRYPLSAKNDLAFDVSAGRLIYLSGVSKSENYTSILPGTATVFTVFVGPVRVRNSLNVELSEDPVADPLISRSARFGRFNAHLGTQVDWDMNFVVWQLTGSVGRQFATEEANRQIDLWRYSAGLRTVFPKGPGFFWGLSTTHSTGKYDLSVQHNPTSHSLGAFGQIPLGRALSVEASVGVQSTDFDESGSIVDRDGFDGIYASLSLSHQMRRTLSYTISAKRNIDEGYGSNFYRITDISVAPKLTILKRWDLVGNIGWQWIDVSGPSGERATRFVLSMEARRPLGRKLDGTIGLSHYERYSDQPGNEYVQNRASFSLRYIF